MWTSLLLLEILFFTACQYNSPKQTYKPNILFVFADDQRADALGLMQNPYLKTPTIDALVENGVRFDNCYVMG